MDEKVVEKISLSKSLQAFHEKSTGQTTEIDKKSVERILFWLEEEKLISRITSKIIPKLKDGKPGKEKEITLISLPYIDSSNDLFIQELEKSKQPVKKLKRKMMNMFI